VFPENTWDGGYWEFDPDMPRATRRKYRGLYQVCFDGSGTIGQHKAYVYAGAISTQLQWQAFSETWEHVLAKNDLAYFKMAEADTFYGEWQPKYTEWGNDRAAKRDAVLLELALLRRRYDLKIRGAGFVVGQAGMSPFDDTDSVADRKRKTFQIAITNLLREIPSEFAVQIVCDVEKDVEEKYRGWIEGLMRTESDKVARIVGINFLDDQYSQPIQFADMVSWLGRQEIERQMFRPEQGINPLYELLTEGTRVVFEPSGPGMPIGAEMTF
jgi:hypothetical protein